MFKSLMTSRRFAPLFWCQFCSALNDNFLKNALGMLILFGIAGSGQAAGGNAGVLITLSGIIFIAPFFILSALGGELADRFDKAYVAERIKLAEIPVAGLAAIGFFLHSVPILMLALGLFGILASLFGPVKYGMLPEKLDTAELSAGNALVEGATFLAILIGTIAGGIAVAAGAERRRRRAGDRPAGRLRRGCSRAPSPRLAPAAPDLAITRNPWTSTLALLRELRQGDPRLWGGAHIVSWFWLVGFVALSLLPALVKDSIGGSEGVVTLCLATFTVGIALGLGACGPRQPRQAEPGAGAARRHPDRRVLAGRRLGRGRRYARQPADRPAGRADVARRPGAASLSLFGLAVSGGLYIVPSFAAVQSWAPPERRARVIAAVNVMNAAYMVGAGAVVAGLQAAGVGLGALFAALGVLSFGAGAGRDARLGLRPDARHGTARCSAFFLGWR